MPYAEFLAPSTREALRDVFRKSVVTHGSHRSIAIWTLFNEGWGIDLDDNPDDRCWLIETFDMAKTLVPDSLVVDNSPCFSSENRYRGLPLVQWVSPPERSFLRDRARIRRPRPMDLFAARRRSKPRRRAARLLGIRGVGAAASQRCCGEGRKLALAVRKAVTIGMTDAPIRMGSKRGSGTRGSRRSSLEMTSREAQRNPPAPRLLKALVES
jgi:hypothetical protein